MANTYSQNYVHLIFSVKFREYIIRESYRDEVEKVMCGMIIHRKCKPMAIYCNPDHVHILIGFPPNILISDLARDIKSGSSKLINEKNWFGGIFRWQDGYGSFTVCNSHVPRVINYILNQPEHHKKQSFKEEYLQMLQENEVRFEEKYAFEPTL
jgi:putative transposase